MIRSKRRARNSQAMKLTNGNRWSEMTPDAKMLIVTICRAAVPSMPREVMSDEELVASAFELIGKGFLDVYFYQVPEGLHVFTDLKKPGRGVVSTSDPVLVPFIAGHA